MSTVTSSSPNGFKGYVLFLLPAALAALIFLPTVGHPFVWDDFPFLVHNESLRSLENIPSFFVDESTAAARVESPGVYRPLRNVLWALGYGVFKGNAAGYHLQNIALHALNALLVACLAIGLGLRRDAAAVAGCVFAVHPVVSEAVSWIKAVDDLLVATFLVAGAIVSAKLGRQLGQDGAVKRSLWVFLGLLQLAALSSKESGVVFPALAAMTLWLSFELTRERLAGQVQMQSLMLFLRTPAVLVYLGAAALLDIAYLLVRTRVLGEVGQLEQPLATGATLFFTQMRATGQGLWLVLWPGPLQADYNSYRLSTGLDPGSTMAIAAVLVLLATMFFALARGRAWSFWAWIVAWWFVVLVPISNLVPTMQFLAERFLYAAMVAPAIGLGCLFHFASRWQFLRKSTLMLSAILLIAVLALRTSYRISDWSSAVDLFESVVDQDPKVERALGNLARSLFVEGQYQESVKRLRELERLSPSSEVLLDLLADATALAKAEQQLPDMLSAIDLEPQNLDLRLQLIDLALHARHLGTARNLLDGLPEDLAWRRHAAGAVVAAHRGERETAMALLERAEAEMAGLSGENNGPEVGLDRWRTWVDRALAETSRLDFLPPEKPPEGFSPGLQAP